MELAFISYYRFGNLPKQNKWGGFYPVRSVVHDRSRLVVNLLETDEFYDLQDDPYELENRLYNRPNAAVRDQMHDTLLTFMDDITDPLRSHLWEQLFGGQSVSR